MPEQERYRPSIEEIVEGKFGKEMLEEAAGTTKEIYETIKQGLANIGLGEGSSSQQRQAAESYLAMLREFANNLFARTASENLTSPEKVRTAIEGANALLSAEPTDEGKAAAEKMMQELERRY